ncbi:MAG: glutamine-hydrolyzing GMP synthase, partial [Acidimicrobiales bacterium]
MGTVLVVDFGAQYAQLIARRVREARVYSEIVPHTISAAEIQERSPAGIILSGGPNSVHVENAPQLDPDIYGLGIPILGICYGAQLLAQQLGGVVARTGNAEYGRTALSVMGPSTLLVSGLDAQDVWMSHFDAISVVPEGFRVTASSPDAPIAVLEHTERRIHGVQFHPEVAHTTGGQRLLERFLHEVCGLPGDWTMGNVLDTQVAMIREQVGSARLICGLSGGVDSAVAAALVHRAVGSQLTCVFVDTEL